MSPDTVVLALIEDAAAWRLLGLLFERPREAWRAEVAALAREVDDTDLRAAAESAQQAREADYLAVLGPGSELPGREVGHDRFADPGQLLSELEAHYQAFAYYPRTEQPADHVSVEAGFVAYLRLKEAYARASGQPEAAALTASVTARFLDEHVSLWAQPLADGLAATEIPHLQRAGHAAFRRVGPPRRMQPDAPPSSDCPMACGAEPMTADIEPEILP